MNELVFPTQVGVFPYLTGGEDEAFRLPHTGGGVSKNPSIEGLLFESSPHRWGCFLTQRHSGRNAGVFPTQVGVFLTIPPEAWSMQGLPHTGGGVSNDTTGSVVDAGSSPHRWGCF